MAETTTFFPRRLILGGAVISGVLLALAVHMLGARYGLDLGGLWRSDARDFMPAGAAIAWWLIATVGFCGGYFTANLMHSAVEGQIPRRMRQFLIAVGVLLLAGAGQAAAAPSPVPTISGVLAGIAALCLGAVVAFCGAHFALRKACACGGANFWRLSAGLSLSICAQDSGSQQGLPSPGDPRVARVHCRLLRAA